MSFLDEGDTIISTESKTEEPEVIKAGVVSGYKGDMVLFKDLKDFEVVKVFNRFGKVYEDKPTPMPIIPPAVFNSVHLPPLSKESFALKAKEVMPVISLIDGQLVNKREDIPSPLYPSLR